MASLPIPVRPHLLTTNNTKSLPINTCTSSSFSSCNRIVLSINKWRPFSTKATSSSSKSNGGIPTLNTPKPEGGPLILELPVDQIRRPLMRTRNNDPQKVKELMDSIRQIGLQVPIDVLEVDGVYYGFSGCHRYEAHQRLGLPTIRCKIRRGTKETLRHHMR